MDEDQVRKAATWTRRRALGEAVPSSPTKLDRAVWEKTKEEVQNGWLRGPRTEQQLVREFGDDAVVARRFGVEQGRMHGSLMTWRPST